jgi:hypothetical protein
MQRAGSDHHKVGDQPVMNESVNEIAYSAGPD